MIINKAGRFFALATISLGAALASAQQIGVQVDGNSVNFNGTTPKYVDGRVLVPLRGVFEEMGAYVHWNRDTRTVTAEKLSTVVSLHIGDKWARVDGKPVSMDVPAMIMGGSTMVPIRFVSEALGAQVQWNDPDRMVMITTTDLGFNNQNNSRPDRFSKRVLFTLPAGTVVPVVLQTRVSSYDSRKGDEVKATVSGFNTGPITNEKGDWDFPNGTIVEGQVVSAVRKDGSKPGLVELKFNRIVMPDGRTAPIDGSLIALDSKNVERNDNGVLVAKSSSRDNRMVYAGYGAGGGLIVGLLTRKPLESAAIGGIVGYLAGLLEQSQKRSNDVTLESGTRFGVRLNSSTPISVPISPR